MKMATLNMQEIAEKVSENVLDGLMFGKHSLRELGKMCTNGEILELNCEYSSRDYVIETRQDGDSQTFVIRKRKQ